LDYYDSVGVFLQAYVPVAKGRNSVKELKKQEVNIFKVEKPTLKKRTFANLPAVTSYWDHDAYLVKVQTANNMLDQMRRFRDIELGEVTVTGRRSTMIPDKRAEFYENNSFISLEVTEDMYAFQNIFHLLKARFGYKVIGDEFSINPPPILTLGSGRISSAGRFSGAKFIVDGNPTFNNQIAAAMPLHQIERIDILTGPNVPSLYGAGGNGVINILSKSGNPNRDFSDVTIRGNATVAAKGYVPMREFYTGSEMDMPLGLDYRSTIYWNPEVRTDANGKAKLNFRLSDGNPEVWVRVEGLSDAGEPVFTMHKFKVEGN
jgi:hypothetical protein